MSHTLRIENLTCHYEQQSVIESLDLTVNRGDIVCLLGASGCGKTTLLKAIAGLLPLTEGRVTLNEQLLDNGEQSLPPEQRNMGLIFQDYALFPHLTVAENIAFSFRAKTGQAQQQIVSEMLSLIHLPGYEQRYPHQLSGGQQQRVAIARSLAYQPDLLLLDEPFSNIDNQVRHELILHIRDIFKRQGVTAIFVTHNREEAFAFADKMALMDQGRIVQFGEASTLYHQPMSRFVADFLGESSYLLATKLTDEAFGTVIGRVSAQSVGHIAIGDECQLLLRPNNIALKLAGDGPGEVVARRFMGDHHRYAVQVDGIQLIAAANEQFPLSAKVSLGVKSQQITAFRRG